MAKEFDEKLYDLRVVAKNIKSGLISAKDHEKYLKAVGDVADNAVNVETTLGSSGQTPRTAEIDEE